MRTADPFADGMEWSRVGFASPFVAEEFTSSIPIEPVAQETGSPRLGLREVLGACTGNSGPAAAKYTDGIGKKICRQQTSG